MINRITVRLNAIEAILYFWEATIDREKVGERYLIDLSEIEEMKALYDEEFNKDSVRKVLSAISNREILNSESKKERKFWNNNMWVMEDMELTNMMLSPLKTLNLDDLVQELNETDSEAFDEELQVVLVPDHHRESYRKGNTLYLNFFRIQADLYEENKLMVDQKPIKDYIKEKFIEFWT